MCWWSGPESRVFENGSVSCICITHLTSEGVREGLLGDGSVFNDDDVGFLGVLDSILIELVVIC